VPDLAFVMAPTQNHFFVELVAALRHELEVLGVESVVSTHGFPVPRPGLVYVLVPPHEYFVLAGSPRGVDRRLLARSVFLCAEQPGTVHFDQNARLARRAGAVFDINAWSAREYQCRGIEAEHLQLGYSGYWDRFTASSDRSLDVVFLGSSSPRRDRHIASYAPSFAGLRTRIVLSDNSGPNYAAAENFVIGKTKLDLLSQSSVLINVHQGIYPYFEWLRSLEAIHCGCVIVSEHCVGGEPLMPGRHYVVGEADTLAFLTQEVLEDQSLRDRVRIDAYEFIRRQLPLRAAVERLVECADRVDRQAPSAGASHVAGAMPRPAPAALEQAAAVEPDERQPAEGSEVLLAALKDRRLEMMELRREAIRSELTRDGQPPPLVRRIWASPHYLTRRAVRISVITALYNQAQWVVDALDSVGHQTYRNFELIVIDDGSSDGSLRRVQKWAGDHPDVATVLVNHPVNRGLPHARNTGIDFARGEFALVLDSDNELLPNCMERLIDALDHDTDVSLAYGMMACFRDGEYLGLISKFPWDPARLRDGNYIDALALLRLRVLREMGGYTTDQRLYGWEDYDLYCRLAEHGMRAAFVPELVARYRVSEGSMLSITDISTTNAWRALRERCPRLMADRRTRPNGSQDSRLPSPIHPGLTASN
jgi:GT2 family glycosyltransferase